MKRRGIAVHDWNKLTPLCRMCGEVHLVSRFRREIGLCAECHRAVKEKKGQLCRECGKVQLIGQYRKIGLCADCQRNAAKPPWGSKIPLCRMCGKVHLIKYHRRMTGVCENCYRIAMEKKK